MRQKTTIAVALLLVYAYPAAAQTLRCVVAAKYDCRREGCSPSTPTVINVVDLDESRYSRCDARGCDEYQIVQNPSGLFVNIDVPGRGMVAKVSLDGSVFVEVATLADTVLVSFGTCGTDHAP